jgi:hypothetical protein
MLDVLKGFDMSSIVLPTRVSSRPDRDRLAMRYERFVARNS